MQIMSVLRSHSLDKWKGGGKGGEVGEVYTQCPLFKLSPSHVEVLSCQWMVLALLSASQCCRSR